MKMSMEVSSAPTHTRTRIMPRLLFSHAKSHPTPQHVELQSRFNLVLDENERLSQGSGHVVIKKVSSL